MHNKRQESTPTKAEAVARAAAILKPTVTDKGVMSVNAGHVLKTDTVKKQLDAVRSIRIAVGALR